MTNHYQHAGNDHANATNVMKHIKHCRSNKSSLQSETTKNQRLHKIPWKHFGLQPSLTQLLAALLEGTADRFESLQWVHHWLCSYECGLQEF